MCAAIKTLFASPSQIAALPISKLKARRMKIAEGSTLIDNGDWSELRGERPRVGESAVCEC